MAEKVCDYEFPALRARRRCGSSSRCRSRPRCNAWGSGWRCCGCMRSCCCGSWRYCGRVSSCCCGSWRCCGCMRSCCCSGWRCCGRVSSCCCGSWRCCGCMRSCCCRSWRRSWHCCGRVSSCRGCSRRCRWSWRWRATTGAEPFHRAQQRDAVTSITACQPNSRRAVGIGREVAPRGDEWNPY